MTPQSGAPKSKSGIFTFSRAATRQQLAPSGRFGTIREERKQKELRGKQRRKEQLTVDPSHAAMGLRGIVAASAAVLAILGTSAEGARMSPGLKQRRHGGSSSSDCGDGGCKDVTPPDTVISCRCVVATDVCACA